MIRTSLTLAPRSAGLSEGAGKFPEVGYPGASQEELRNTHMSLCERNLVSFLTGMQKLTPNRQLVGGAIALGESTA